MKILLSSLLFLASTLPVYPQLHGKVVNDQGEALPFVNVLLLNASDSAMVSGSLSANDGSFRIDEVESGRYVLHLKLIGFESWYSETFSYHTGQPDINFGTLPLREETILIDGVMVTAQRMQIEQHMEGTTLNVQSSLMSKGSSALQILENSPGVVRDRRNNELMLNGKSGTLIMINGRPVRMAPAEVLAMLEGMSVDNLEKVELLINPSAKYDSDGSAGIINLVTKKQEDEGTNGSASVSGGYGWGPKQAVSLNLNHRKGSVNYNGSYSFNYDHFFSDFHGTGFQTIPAIAIRTTNENGQSAKEIAGLWGRFMNENVLDAIPNKVDSKVYSLYTDYDGDHTEAYTAILGCRVNSLNNIPDGMTGKAFSGGNYFKTTARGDLSKGLIVNEWSKIFKLDLERNFTADFEVFGEKAQNPADAEIHFFVGVK